MSFVLCSEDTIMVPDFPSRDQVSTNDKFRDWLFDLFLLLFFQLFTFLTARF